MRKMFLLMAAGIILVMVSTVAVAEDKAPQKVVDFANSTLVKLGTDPVIVNAVKAENAKGKTMQQIKDMDEKWKSTPGIADYMKAMMESECGKHLQGIQKNKSYYSEMFVMDNQGANVCMSDKTSDYWQGDEDKFTESYNEGKGSVHIGEVKFDDSTQTYLSQVSVPVKDGEKVIGAITIGIDIDRLEN